MKRWMIILLLGAFLTPAQAITKEALADSLTRYIGFVSAVPPVKITKMKVKGSSITIYTNKTLSGAALTNEDLYRLRLQVSRWVFRNNNGKVTIYSDNKELKDLVVSPTLPKGTGKTDLTDRHIALWASHGIYYNRDEDRWKWQRAALWMTVEDVFTNAFSRLVVQMLENAHATVYQPRGQIGDPEAMAIGESGYPRWSEGARYWLQYKGVPDSIWCDSIDSDQYRDDIKARARWVNWLCGGSKKNPKQPGQGIPIDLSIALHTDGYNILYDTAMVGTLAIYSEEDPDKKKVLGNGQNRAISRGLAHIVQSQLVNDMRNSVCPDWPRRELLNAGYYEAKCPVVPSMLLEMFSHLQMRDMHYGLDPAVRFRIARAIYKGLGRWLEGSSFVVQPLPVQAFGMSFNGEGLTLHWKATPDPLEPSAQPSEYLIERRVNDGAWDIIGKSKAESISFAIERGKRYEFRVIATNAGGKSFPSEILSAYLSTAPDPMRVLIVNAFDTVCGPKWFADSLTAGIIPEAYPTEDGIAYHYIGAQTDFDRSHVWVSDDECGWGMCHKDYITRPVVGNTHDYPVQHGRILQQMGISYISSNIVAIDTTMLRRADIVDIVLGNEERTERYLSLLPYCRSILVSGAHVGGLIRAGHSEKLIWGEQVLRYHRHPNEHRLVATEVSSFIPQTGQVVARYQDTYLPAAIRTDQGLMWGIPLESLEAFEHAYRQSIELLQP